MNRPIPPSYQDSEAMSNPHYSGPNPTYPNTMQEQYHKNSHQFPQHGYPPTEHTYPTAGQSNVESPYPMQNPHPVYVQSVQHPGTSVHVVGAATPVPMVRPIGYMGPTPTTVMCPTCKEYVTTSVETESGMLTWLVVGGLCLFGCWFGCCLIPFCMDSCKDAYHTCPRCKTSIGRFTRLR